MEMQKNGSPGAIFSGADNGEDMRVF